MRRGQTGHLEAGAVELDYNKLEPDYTTLAVIALWSRIDT